MNDIGETTASGWSLAVPDARRSLVLCALGAVLGLGVAGLGLFTARGTRTSAVPAEDAALVNQVPILMSDYIQQLRALYDVPLSAATPAQKRKVLDDMIREELYVQRGVELGLQADTIEVRTALVGAVEALSAADARMAQPTEAEQRDYYRRNQAAFADEGVLELADHVLPHDTPEVAIDAARAGLQAAGGNAQAANRAAPRSGRMVDGEEYYFAARIHLGQPLFDVARRLKAGDVSAPVRMPDGIHLIVMKKNVPPVAPSFEQVRTDVLAAYVDAQSRRLVAANNRFLRKRADVQVAPGLE